MTKLPTATIDQITRWLVALWGFVDIDRLPPVWITSELAVNESDAWNFAARLPDLIVDFTAKWVLVARREVGVVGVEAFHAPGRPAHAAARAVDGISGKPRVTLASVSRVGRGDGLTKRAVRLDPGLRLSHTTTGFDAGNAKASKRAREPVSGRERLARIEKRGHLRHDRQAQVTPPEDRRGRAQRPPDLKREDFVVVSRAHDTRMRSFTSVQ